MRNGLPGMAAIDAAGRAVLEGTKVRGDEVVLKRQQRATT
jgi:hypothetical protein